LAILLNALSIRDCQPGPLALKYEITSGLNLIDTATLVGAFRGPRVPLELSEQFGRQDFGGRSCLCKVLLGPLRIVIIEYRFFTFAGHGVSFPCDAHDEG